MSDFTPNLGLPYLLSNQAQKHVTLNESLRALDGLLQLSVTDRDLSSPPVSPDEGGRYLIASGATGGWSGHDGQIALFSDGGWLFFEPATGWRAWVEDESRFLVFDGLVWRETTSDALQNLTRLGLGATADASNPLLAKLSAMLFTALEVAYGGSGDLRAKLNKEASGNVLSLLFQSGYTTHAEVGLVGDNDFLFKVSPDGATFYEGIRIDKDTGEVSFPNGTSNFRERLTANRTYYVNSSAGSDTNTGLSTGAAFATLSKAVEVLHAIDIGGYEATVQLASGTYDGVSITTPFHGGSVKFVGDTTSPSNVEIGGGGYCFRVINKAVISVEGLYFNSGYVHLNADLGGVINVTGHCKFGAASAAQISASGSGSSIFISANYELAGGSAYHIRSGFGASVSMFDHTVTITGTLNFSVTFIEGAYAGTFYMANITYAGDAALTTGVRYQAFLNGVISTNGGGASYFPGDVAGSTSSGGQYV